MWDQIAAIFSIGLFQNTIRNATPVILAALGGLFTEHAGIMNIGMEGMILTGAFVAVAFSFMFVSAPMGSIGGSTGWHPHRSVLCALRGQVEE